jgi:hypothetical protein
LWNVSWTYFIFPTRLSEPLNGRNIFRISDDEIHWLQTGVCIHDYHPNACHTCPFVVASVSRIHHSFDPVSPWPYIEQRPKTRSTRFFATVLRAASRFLTHDPRSPVLRHGVADAPTPCSDIRGSSTTLACGYTRSASLAPGPRLNSA